MELCAEGSYESVIQAIDSGIDPNEPAIINGTPARAMFVAASSENCGAMRALIERGAEMGEGFVASVICNKMYVAEYLRDWGGDINALDSSGMNALITAATMKRPEIVEELLYLDADPNAKSHRGYTALTYIALMMVNEQQKAGEYTSDPDMTKIASMLLEYGADYLEAMMISIKENMVNIIELLDECGKDLNFQDADGRSLVMLSVMSDSGFILDYLLLFGADPDLPDNMGRTPLMIAAIDEEAEPSIIETLLEYGADINARDNRGITPLMWSVVGADKTPSELLPALIRTGGLRAEGWKQWLAFISLYNAAKRELELEMIRRLIREGADVNAVDKRGLSAIMYALLDGDDEVADILAEAGAKINFDMNREE